MSTKSKNLNQQELLNTQNSVNDEHTNKEDSFKFYNAPIPNTPFRCLGDDRNGYILTLGKYRLAGPEPTPENIENLLDTDRWNIIFNMIATMLKINEEMSKNTLENTDQNT